MEILKVAAGTRAHRAPDTLAHFHTHTLSERTIARALPFYTYYLCPAARSVLPDIYIPASPTLTGCLSVHLSERLARVDERQTHRRGSSSSPDSPLPLYAEQQHSSLAFQRTTVTRTFEGIPFAQRSFRTRGRDCTMYDCYNETR